MAMEFRTDECRMFCLFHLLQPVYIVIRRASTDYEVGHSPVLSLRPRFVTTFGEISRRATSTLTRRSRKRTSTAARSSARFFCGVRTVPFSRDTASPEPWAQLQRRGCCGKSEEPGKLDGTIADSVIASVLRARPPPDNRGK